MLDRSKPVHLQHAGDRRLLDRQPGGTERHQLFQHPGAIEWRAAQCACGTVSWPCSLGWWEDTSTTQSLSVFPAFADIFVRYVWFTSGAAVISLPTSNDTATVEGGPNGLILATDIAAVSAQGHTTVYPSKERTVGLAVALANNTVPLHTVLHSGACTEADGLDYLNEELD